MRVNIKTKLTNLQGGVMYISYIIREGIKYFCGQGNTFRTAQTAGEFNLNLFEISDILIIKKGIKIPEHDVQEMAIQTGEGE